MSVKKIGERNEKIYADTIVDFTSLFSNKREIYLHMLQHLADEKTNGDIMQLAVISFNRL